MKFGKQLEQNFAKKEWKDYYVDYQSLKKLLESSFEKKGKKDRKNFLNFFQFFGGHKEEAGGRTAVPTPPAPSLAIDPSAFPPIPKGPAVSAADPAASGVLGGPAVSTAFDGPAVSTAFREPLLREQSPVEDDESPREASKLLFKHTQESMPLTDESRPLHSFIETPGDEKPINIAFGNDEEQPQLLRFNQMAWKELQKVNVFYNTQMDFAKEAMVKLAEHVHSTMEKKEHRKRENKRRHKRGLPPIEGGLDDPEATLRRLENYIVQLRSQFKDLADYSETNFLAFRKIYKKRDKLVQKQFEKEREEKNQQGGLATVDEESGLVGDSSVVGASRVTGSALASSVLRSDMKGDDEEEEGPQKALPIVLEYLKTQPFNIDTARVNLEKELRDLSEMVSGESDAKDHCDHWKFFESRKKGERLQIFSFFLGCLTVLLVDIGIMCSVSASNPLYQEKELMAMFPMFRLIAMLVLLEWGIAWAMHFMEHYRVNYRFLLDVDTRCQAQARDFAFFASVHSIMWVLMFGAYLADFKFAVFGRHTWYFLYPMCLFVFYILGWLLPAIRFRKKHRAQMFKLVLTVLLAGIYPIYLLRGVSAPSVTFTQNLMGDVLTSLAKPLGDLEYAVCYYGTGWYHKEPVSCPDFDYWARPLVTMIPFWIRFCQCLCRYHQARRDAKKEADKAKKEAQEGGGGDSSLQKKKTVVISAETSAGSGGHGSGERGEHDDHAEEEGDVGFNFSPAGIQALNTCKYATGIAVIIASSVPWENMGFSIFVSRLLWVFPYVVSTIYNFLWDIVQDWGLAREPDHFLRQQHMYPSYFYYANSTMNLVFRLSWALTLMPPEVISNRHVNSNLLVFFISAFEIVRRCTWSVIRIENEHLNNTSRYRLFLWVPPLRDQAAEEEDALGELEALEKKEQAAQEVKMQMGELEKEFAINFPAPEQLLRRQTFHSKMMGPELSTVLPPGAALASMPPRALIARQSAAAKSMISGAPVPEAVDASRQTSGASRDE